MRVRALHLANCVVLASLAITACDLVTGLEHWPFGSYPMYSTLYSDQLSWLRFYGVTDRGEIELRGDRDFAPFDQARLVVALQRLQASGNAQRIDEALRNLIDLHNRRQPPAARLRGLRLYAVRWTLRPGLEGSEPPQGRTMIAEVFAPVAGP